MNRRSFLKWMAAAAGTSLIGGAAYANQANSIEVSNHRVVLPGLGKSLRLVAISDVHAPSFFKSENSLIDHLVSLKPAILILGGDIIDEKQNEGVAEYFRQVPARYGKFAVLGNWEYRSRLDLNKLMEKYLKAGIALLVNERVDIGGVTVVGLDDFLEGQPDYRLLAGIQERPCIAVSHCPEAFDEMDKWAKSPVVCISGHTHGGQIAPFGSALVKPKGCGTYDRGWYHQGEHSMYVMRGVGTSGIPIRIGSPPEIAVVDLEPNNL